MSNTSKILQNIESWRGVRKTDPEGPWKFWSHNTGQERASFIQAVIEEFYPTTAPITDIKSLADYENILKDIYKNSMQGKYLVRFATTEPLIIHIKKHVNLDQLRIGSTVFTHFRKHGLHTTEVLTTTAGELTCEKDGYIIYFTRFMEGRHLYAQAEEMEALGQTNRPDTATRTCKTKSGIYHQTHASP